MADSIPILLKTTAELLRQNQELGSKLKALKQHSRQIIQSSQELRSKPRRPASRKIA